MYSSGWCAARIHPMSAELEESPCIPARVRRQLPRRYVLLHDMCPVKLFQAQGVHIEAVRMFQYASKGQRRTTRSYCILYGSLYHCVLPGIFCLCVFNGLPSSQRGH